MSGCSIERAHPASNVVERWERGEDWEVGCCFPPRLVQADWPPMLCVAIDSFQMGGWITKSHFVIRRVKNPKRPQSSRWNGALFPPALTHAQSSTLKFPHRWHPNSSSVCFHRMTGLQVEGNYWSLKACGSYGTGRCSRNLLKTVSDQTGRQRAQMNANPGMASPAGEGLRVYLAVHHL